MGPSSDEFQVDPSNNCPFNILNHIVSLSFKKFNRTPVLIYNITPDEIYHLGAQSHVRVSFDMPEYTGDVTAMGTTRILEAIRKSAIKTKFYQASTSELFGASPPPQNERTPLCPRSPYAAAKVYAYWMTVNYREGYRMFASNGILFNHESPRRGETFVTKKITRAVANIISGKQEKVYLGNLDARRDWGFAPEYVECQWLILQKNEPEDYVIGTGESHSIRDLVRLAFEYAGLEIEWRGSDDSEKGIVQSIERSSQNRSQNLKIGDVVVEIDPHYYRPTEVEDLVADASKAKKELGWEPGVGFEELVKIMVDADMRQSGVEPKGEGDKVLGEKGIHWTKNKVSFH